MQVLNHEQLFGGAQAWSPAQPVGQAALVPEQKYAPQLRVAGAMVQVPSDPVTLQALQAAAQAPLQQ